MKAKTSDCSSRDIAISDAINTEESSFAKSWPTSMAAFELALLADLNW
jgi:hypothetical protein